MFDLGPHAAFVWLSYAAAMLCIAGLILWAWVSELVQARRLAQLERRGMKRRSSRPEG